jgi:hypothetical protein
LSKTASVIQRLLSRQREIGLTLTIKRSDYESDETKSLLKKVLNDSDLSSKESDDLVAVFLGNVGEVERAR